MMKRPVSRVLLYLLLEIKGAELIAESGRVLDCRAPAGRSQ